MSTPLLIRQQKMCALDQHSLMEHSLVNSVNATGGILIACVGLFIFELKNKSLHRSSAEFDLRAAVDVVVDEIGADFRLRLAPHALRLALSAHVAHHIAPRALLVA